MSMALGTRSCGSLGCSRAVEVSPTGIRHARCGAHESRIQTRAFGIPQQEARVVPPQGSDFLPGDAPAAVDTSG